MRQNHEPCDLAFIDYTGEKFPYYPNGVKTWAEVYVAILGASQLTYAEASESQKQEEFVRSTERALRYFGGAPRALVPDSLKSAVIKASKYEPEINPLFDDFADYYRTTILPARATNQGINRWQRMPSNWLINESLHLCMISTSHHSSTLEQLNVAIAEQLEIHNNRKLTKLDISRRDLFEEIEADSLKTLPTELYPIKYFENHKVAPDYHFILSEDKHYYSVPWQLKGQQVKIIFDERNVAVYHNNVRIAQHRRNRKKVQYTTITSHMPAYWQANLTSNKHINPAWGCSTWRSRLVRIG